MIDRSKLMIKIMNHHNKEQEIKEDERRLLDLQEVFKRKFPLVIILDLSLEEYVIGLGRDDTFCYLLEKKLTDLGSIKMGRSIKFGIYYSKSGRYIASRSRFGYNDERAFPIIKEEIVKLIKAGERNNTDEILENKISPMFKGKILATYFHDKFLSIFADEKLCRCLDQLGIKYDTNLDEVLKRELLMEFKEKDDIMKGWSIYQYMKFLWETFAIETEINEQEIQVEKDSIDLLDNDMAYLLEDMKNNEKIRKKVRISLIQRNPTLVRKLKELYDNKCQICHFTFEKETGQYYSECHHIISLGEEGSDTIDNVIVVCANCHRMLHYADVTISNEIKDNTRDVLINDKQFTITYRLMHSKLLIS